MKITCSKESLLKVLNVAESIISTKSSISILSNILLEAYNNKLKISASETKISFFAEIGADIINEGSISIHCNKFYSITRKLPGDEIEINIDNDNQLLLNPKNNSNIKYKIKGLESEKFPKIKQVDELNFYSIKQSIMYNLIKRTIFAISESENRRFVSGVYFETGDNIIKLVATDGKRLSLVKYNLPLIKFETGIIIPPKILIETLKLCSDNGDLQLALNKNEICIKINNFCFISNLLDGNFPPYEKVIPEDQSIIFKINKKILFDSIDRITQISDKESHKITFTLVKNELNIHTEDITIGSGDEILPVEYSGEEFKISLNSLYISDVLNVISNENVIFELKDPNTTVVIKEENNNDFIYIMMPMTS